MNCPKTFPLPFIFLLLAISTPTFAVQSSSKIAESSRTPSDEGEARELPPISNEMCQLPKDRGFSCTGARGNANGTVKWFFDVQTLECLAFGYHGCGGNANKFDSVFECRQVCQLPADYGGCSGRKASAKNAAGESIICGPHTTTAEKCPPGYQCQNMAFYGICCDSKTEEIYTRNYRPKCANGKEPQQLQDELNNWPVIVLGKLCLDQFCPANMDCVGQEVFAHCCPK